MPEKKMPPRPQAGNLNASGLGGAVIALRGAALA